MKQNPRRTQEFALRSFERFSAASSSTWLSMNKDVIWIRWRRWPWMWLRLARKEVLYLSTLSIWTHLLPKLLATMGTKTKAQRQVQSHAPRRTQAGCGLRLGHSLYASQWLAHLCLSRLASTKEWLPSALRLSVAFLEIASPGTSAQQGICQSRVDTFDERR